MKDEAPILFSWFMKNANKINIVIFNTYTCALRVTYITPTTIPINKSYTHVYIPYIPNKKYSRTKPKTQQRQFNKHLVSEPKQPTREYLRIKSNQQEKGMIQLRNWKRLQCPHLALQLAPTIKKIVKHLILKNSLFGIVSSSWRTLSKYKENRAMIDLPLWVLLW
ncbi:hypothetical protein Scep_019264 [Stephania cephalantha]|uniref:Uncharacterized protein n=1 Tax=Stephania cephalantha TaxID=152367 RepID=A0AAP0NN42_9MAGN